MIVSHKGGVIRIAALNDLDYVYDQIPPNIRHLKEKHPEETQVEIELEVYGTYARNTPSKRDSTIRLSYTLGSCNGKKIVDTLQRRVESLRKGGLEVKERLPLE